LVTDGVGARGKSRNQAEHLSQSRHVRVTPTRPELDTVRVVVTDVLHLCDVFPTASIVAIRPTSPLDSAQA